MSYVIKTDKFNIFYGTRAESILNGEETDKRAVCGEIARVIPAVSHIRDMDKVVVGNVQIPLEVIENALTPKEIMGSVMEEKDFYYTFLKEIYGVSLVNNPVDKDLLIIGFGEMHKLSYWDLMRKYKKAEKLVLYEQGIDPQIAKVEHRRNRYHNAFFDSQLTEKVQDKIEEKGIRRILLTGGILQDQIFHSAIGAVDMVSELDKDVEVIVSPKHVHELGNSKARIDKLVRDHFVRRLNVEVKKDYRIEPKKGVTIFMR